MAEATQRTRVADALVSIPCNRDNFIRWWFELLKPMHRLTDKECEVATALIRKRIELSRKIVDEKLLDRTLFSKEVRQEIAAEAHVTQDYFRVILTTLRQRGIVNGKAFNKRYIPSWDASEEKFSFRLMFILGNELGQGNRAGG